MATFFTADTHFNHAGIIKHCGRGHATVEDMNRDMIERWNNTVRARDTIWVLGDFAFKAAGQMREELRALFYRLNGIKRLVVGNHDERNPEILRLPWNRIERLFTFKENGRRAELCHYPLETWKSQANGALMLHGHSHGMLTSKIYGRYDVGWDVYGRPLAWEEILELAARDRQCTKQ